jgi:hypothetical protein
MRVADFLERSGSRLDVTTGGQVDLLVTDHRPAPTQLERLVEGGILVGIGAREIGYEGSGLPHGRRVGDDLWVGSRIEPDYPGLFEGATLVKFGDESP